MRNAKAIPSEFQHALVIADIDEKKIMKVVIKTCTERRKITLLKCEDHETIKKRVVKLFYFGAQTLWGHIMDGLLNAYDEVCGGKRGRRSKGDTWWWKEEVKEAVSRKKGVQ